MALKMQQISGEIEELQRQKREVQANIASGASNNAALLQRFRYKQLKYKFVLLRIKLNDGRV